MKKITVFMFIDALGWKIIKDRDLLKDISPPTGNGIRFYYNKNLSFQTISITM
ncbi:MAG: hypothetical protein JRD04_11055 [Deltaproteobacteria bacterium]|nr:hypothetical protein [Deltaproteobacteria bacterium]